MICLRFVLNKVYVMACNPKITFSGELFEFVNMRVAFSAVINFKSINYFRYNSNITDEHLVVVFIDAIGVSKQCF